MRNKTVSLERRNGVALENLKIENWKHKSVRNLYKGYIKPILFKLDPEKVHDMTILMCRIAGFSKTSLLLRKHFVFESERLRNKCLGIEFDNPVGLSAGFDKNAHLIGFLPDIGFGFMEVGSVTANPCLGNKKPRLHRLVKDKGIIVNYGLVNEGAEKIISRLRKVKSRIPLGISIAKTNDPSICGEDSVDDYFRSFKILRKTSDFITINISCPNVGDGRSFEDIKLLESLLRRIKKIRGREKILLNISPDIELGNIDKIMELARKYEIDGFILSNLTKKREGLSKDKKLKYEGGVSGKAVGKKSNKLIKYVYRKSRGEFLIIGSGGIFNGRDAYEKIKSGASLVQLITGMIFEGPGVIKKINVELDELLRRDGYSNIREAIGIDVRKIN